MLTSIHEPVQEVEIQCDQMKKFYSLPEAKLYAQMKNYMVIKEQDQNMWYVMPKYDGFLVGGCAESDN